MADLQGVKKLNGVVQPYSWGGKKFVSELLGRPNAEEQPQAEYWLGAHPNHSALLAVGNERLSDAITADGPSLLGEPAWNRFGQLPYLLKVLDVRAMLSIQVHPSAASAVEGYEREDAEGIPLNAPHRNYKDRNHKPELMVALSQFWLLHGFKEASALRRVLTRVPEFRFLISIFGIGEYRQLYETVMLMHPSEIRERLSPLAERLLPAYEAGTLDKGSEDFWAARALTQYGAGDRGIFSIYFFNLLNLQPGEGIYQPAGLPHAYLEGQNVEIMANSDNVLRAGLTDKHIDVPELLRHVRFFPVEPQVIVPEEEAHTIYASPAAEFELHRYRVSEAIQIETKAGETWLVTESAVRIQNEEGSLELNRGEAVFVLPGQVLSVEAAPGAELFRATLPTAD